MIGPGSVLRMTVEREEVPFYNIRFESKPQRHQAFDKWVGQVIVQPSIGRGYIDIVSAVW